MSRTRRHGSRLQVSRGDRYALLPSDVAESDAWKALPHYAARVLIALLLEFHGHNNGCLGLTATQARTRGVNYQRELYSGLKVLTLADLIVCTRRGRLERGTKLPSLYAVTWKGIDEPQKGVAYDAGVAVCPLPRNDYAKWQKPADWGQMCRSIMRAMRGQTKNPVSPPWGEGRSPQWGASSSKSTHHSGEKEAALAAHHNGETSKTSGLGAARGLPGGTRCGPAVQDDAEQAIGRLALAQPRLRDADLAAACYTSLADVARVRAMLADGWRPKP